VLIVAESDGRRESLLELLRDHQHHPAQRGHAGRVRGQRSKFCHHRRAAGRRLPSGLSRRRNQPVSIQFITETELFASAPSPPPPQAGAGQQTSTR
jgi:transcription-repair coupling factor (superfamily II helicase)